MTSIATPSRTKVEHGNAILKDNTACPYAVEVSEDEKSVSSSSSSESDDDEDKGILRASPPQTDIPETANTGRKLISLSHALKHGTAEAHQAAEDVHFVKQFIQGNIDRDLYAKLVLGLYFVYDKLEQELDAHAPTHFNGLHFPNQLSRKSALEEDIDFWHGSSVLSSVSQGSNGNYFSNTTQNMNTRFISPATQDYLERMDYVAKNDPLLLLSHAYTRYLGDLSGGKILARVARRAMHLDKSGDGLQFYQFDQVSNEKEFKDMYRTKLDELGLQLSQTQINNLMAEANVAFMLNMRIFEELDVLAGIPGSKVRSMEEAMAFAQNINENGTFNWEEQDELTSDASKCPFLVQKKDKQKRATATSSVGFPANSMQIEADGRCPWPFVFCHDPIQGMQDWQTWTVMGLLLCFAWSSYCL